MNGKYTAVDLTVRPIKLSGVGVSSFFGTLASSADAATISTPMNANAAMGIDALCGR